MFGALALIDFLQKFSMIQSMKRLNPLFGARKTRKIEPLPLVIASESPDFEDPAVLAHFLKTNDLPPIAVDLGRIELLHDVNGVKWVAEGHSLVSMTSQFESFIGIQNEKAVVAIKRSRLQQQSNTVVYGPRTLGEVVSMANDDMYRFYQNHKDKYTANSWAKQPKEKWQMVSKHHLTDLF